MELPSSGSVVYFVIYLTIPLYHILNFSFICQYVQNSIVFRHSLFIEICHMKRNKSIFVNMRHYVIFGYRQIILTHTDPHISNCSQIMDRYIYAGKWTPNRPITLLIIEMSQTLYWMSIK